MIGRQKNPILDRRIRIGVVGCGRISRNHFKAIGEYADDLELVGACDNDPARLDQDFIPGDVPRYDLLPDMLKQAEPDIVAVCTPSGMHPRQTIETAEAGVHVMTEKPMATRWKDGLRMVEACDDAGVHLFVVKQNRFNATLQLLRRAIDEGRFGRIYMAGVNVFWTRPQEYYDTDRWRGTWELDGGALQGRVLGPSRLVLPIRVVVVRRQRLLRHARPRALDKRFLRRAARARVGVVCQGGGVRLGGFLDEFSRRDGLDDTRGPRRGVQQVAERPLAEHEVGLGSIVSQGRVGVDRRCAGDLLANQVQ